MSEPSFAEILESCTERCRKMEAPLSDRLAALADDVRRLDAGFADIVERMVARLRNAGAGDGAPQVGEEMPDFVLPDETGRLVSLQQMIRRGQVIVSFHRGHWCPYCRLSADALARLEPQAREAGARIVLITPEVQEYSRRHKADAGAGFPFLTDLDSGYALELQLAIQINDEKRKAMTAAGWDIAQFHDNGNWTLPIPATFVVGADGRVKSRFVDPDYRKRADMDELLKALKK